MTVAAPSPRFSVGDRVRLSALGVESKISRRCATGVVVAVCAKPHLIVVKRDLFPHPVQYHQDFWELDDGSRIIGVSAALEISPRVRVPRAVVEAPFKRAFVWRGKVRQW